MKSDHWEIGGTAMANPRRPLGMMLIGMSALLWYLAGLAMMVRELTLPPAVLATLALADQQIHAATPAWAYVVSGFAIATGLLGATGLLQARAWSASMFQLSMLGTLVQMASLYAVTPAWDHYGVQGAMSSLLRIAVALLLWRYADDARVRGRLA